ncbi:sugar phosphate isomerase/epimerase family protein [Paenibacillus antri]|nr:sugar phosphate isomerase/epimerase family protein [Paenibacillus antri]
MKKGIHDVPFLGFWNAETFFAEACLAGFDGVELNVLEDGGYLGLAGSDGDRKRVKRISLDCGVPIHSLSTNLHNRYPLSSGAAAIRKRGEEIGMKLIEIAAEIGASIVQIVPGVIARETLYEEAYGFAQESLSTLGKAAREANVILGVENICNHFLPSPKEFRRFLEEIDEPHIQAYLDIGNAMATGYAEHWIPSIGGRIVNIHAKDYRISSREFVSPLSGDVRWPRIMEALRKVRYDGFLITTPPGYAYCSERLMKACSNDLSAILDLHSIETTAGR